MNSDLMEFFSRDNQPNKIKDGAYAIDLDVYSGIGIHCITLYALNNNVTYFDGLGGEHIPKDIKKFIGNKNIQTYICRIQAYIIQ